MSDEHQQLKTDLKLDRIEKIQLWASEQTDVELVSHLVTSDYKGKETKAIVLKELLSREDGAWELTSVATLRAELEQAKAETVEVNGWLNLAKKTLEEVKDCNLTCQLDKSELQSELTATRAKLEGALDRLIGHLEPRPFTAPEILHTITTNWDTIHEGLEALADLQAFRNGGAK